MAKAFIKAISYIFPTTILKNSVLSEQFSNWSEDKIYEKTGIKQRYIAKDDEFASDLAVKAAEKLFAEHSISPGSIDFIIYCTQSPDYILPTTACILQERLGLSNHCGAFDINLGCSGYIYGLAISKGLIEASIAKNILFITSETYSKYIHPDDKGNRTIFGDAASATLISEDGIAEILNFDLGTDGSGASNLIIQDGGSRSKNGGQLVNERQGERFNSSSHLYMNGPEIFAFTSKMVPVLVNRVLENNRVVKTDVDLYIFHQANKFILDFLRKKINIPKGNFFTHIENCGNTVSSTIPIALYEAIALKLCKGNVLLAGFGVGYSWGGVLLNFKK